MRINSLHSTNLYRTRKKCVLNSGINTGRIAQQLNLPHETVKEVVEAIEEDRKAPASPVVVKEIADEVRRESQSDSARSRNSNNN